MDLTRHISLFDPTKLPGRVAIAGCGALGSAVALQLAKLGIKDLVLFDADVVEDHNLPNQCLFGPKDVGYSKVEASMHAIERLTGYIPGGTQSMLTDRTQLDQRDVRMLFVCVDSMAARRSIYKLCVQRNFQMAYFAEGRVGSRTGHVSAFQPSMAHSRAYLEALYDDDDVLPDVGSCGETLMLGATAMMVACQMTWHLMQCYPAKTEGAAPWEILDFDVADFGLYHKGYYVSPAAKAA